MQRTTRHETDAISSPVPKAYIDIIRSCRQNTTPIGTRGETERD